jgi:hypothetical protein
MPRPVTTNREHDRIWLLAFCAHAQHDRSDYTAPFTAINVRVWVPLRSDAVSLFESQFGFPPSDAMGHPALLVDLRADILDPAFGTRSAAA